MWDAQVMLRLRIARMLKAGLMAPAAMPMTEATRQPATMRRSAGARGPRCRTASRAAGRPRGATTAEQVGARWRAQGPATEAKAGSSSEGASLHLLSLVIDYILPASIKMLASVRQCWDLDLAVCYIMRRSARCSGIGDELHAGRGPGCPMKPSAYSCKPSRT